MSDMKGPLVDFEVRGRIHVGTVRKSRMVNPVNVTEFGAEVLDHIESHARLNLLLNFEHVDYLSSAVLNELLRIHESIEKCHGRLRICGISPTIREVFEITNLERVFTINEEPVDVDIRRFERALEVAAKDSAWADLTGAPED
jgi:anti-sigma B factor antagonist